MFYELMRKEYCQIIKEMERIQTQIDKLPEGKLIYTRNGKYSKWYYNNGHETKHLPKKNRKFAQKLSYKKMLVFRLEKLKREKIALDFYLRHHSEDAEKTEQNFYHSSEFQELLSENFKPLKTEFDELSTEMHKKQDFFAENKVYPTLSGLMVRSKSEVLIATLLEQYSLTFEYEHPWKVQGKYFYPDFLIRHPKTGQWILWEHFGLMDDPEYAKRAYEKIQAYIASGIIPGVHMIITFETKNHPLSVKTVEDMIKSFLS